MLQHKLSQFRILGEFKFISLLALHVFLCLEVLAGSPYTKWDNGAAINRIDEIVLENLAREGLKQATLSSDAIFLRRIYIDLTGMIPQASEVWEFINDERVDKRERVIDELMSRDSFNDYWAMRWCDVLRVKAEFPINLWPNGVQAYYRWIHDSIKNNKRYDQFVRELLTTSGSNFRDPPVNFYLAMQGKDASSIARSVGLTFMGIHLEKWDEAQRVEFEKFFSRVYFKGTAEWKETVVINDPSVTEGKQGQLIAVLPNGEKVIIEGGEDPRSAFADWLISNENDWFARAIVNRVWTWVYGKGLTPIADDINIHDLGQHDKLMDYLVEELVKSDWDIKHLIKHICLSRTYQQSSIPQSDDSGGEDMFAFYPVNRLDAEVISDVFVYLFGKPESYMSMVPEPFTWIPEEHRSVELQDGSISSQFLEMFGRPSRDTGSMDERNNQPTRAQKLHLLNSSSVQGRIAKSPRIKAWIKASKGKPNRLINAIYVSILSRRPTPTEIVRVQLYLGDNKKKWSQNVVDIVWALVNTKEFLYRH
ncbi:DUF1553 domain-containing protein [Planctomycetota bacterium]|nr:DUF1553 domain-containing protein [Planctomycetota bacterium]